MEQGDQAHTTTNGTATGTPFQPTHWSLVDSAGGEKSVQALAALEKLCRAYWPPVYAEIRRRGHQPADAQDLTQGFFARLLRGEFFSRASRDKGRFRSYLLGALNHFLLDELSRATAGRRGGGQQVISLNDDEAESWYTEPAAADLTPETAYDKRWAMRLMDCALGRVRDDYMATGRGALFTALSPFLAADSGADGYHAAAAEAGISPHAFCVAVYRLRQRFRESIREEIAATVANPAEVEEEVRYLFSGGG